MTDVTTALDVELPANDSGADTVRGYLATLLITLIEEEEGFSGKRPFGNSGWIYDLAEPLREAGFDPDEKGFFNSLVNELCGTWDEPLASDDDVD